MQSIMNFPPELLAQFGMGAPPAVAPGGAPRTNAVSGRPVPPPAIAMGPGGVNQAPPGPPPPPAPPGVVGGVPQAPVSRGAAFGPPPMKSSGHSDIPIPRAGVPVPYDPRGAAFGAPAKPTDSSDDVGISHPMPTGMPSLPTPPNMSASPVAALGTQFNADAAKLKAFGPAPSPQDYKPSIGRRIGGGLLGALGGGLASLAGERPEDAVKTGESQGGAFTNRKFNNATGNYQRGMTAAKQAVDTDKEGLPFAEAAGKLPQQD
jgi:hypothetical protein